MSQSSPSTPPIDLGPFRPPGTLEPEFHAPVPRPIPDTLRKGRYEHGRRTGVLFGVFFGLSALAAWAVTRPTTLDHYFLALPWFHYVGLAAIALALLAAVVQRFRPGSYAYLRDGIPLPARVRDIRQVVARLVNGQPNSHRYLCTVEYQPPGSTALREAILSSPEFSETFKKSTYTPLRVGDYVTAVALPGPIEKTLTLYGFLQLNPDVDFVRRKGRDPASASPARDALLFVGLLYLVLGLLLGVCSLPSALPVSWPESMDPRWSVPLGAMAAALGAALTWFLTRRSEARREAELRSRNAAARREGQPVEEFTPHVVGTFWRAVLVAGGGLLTVLGLGLVFSCVNSVFDRGAAGYEVVPIRDFQQQTWMALFRSYEVRYLAKDGDTEKLAVPVTQLAWLQQVGPEEGALERRPGFLGLPWVKNIHPVSVGEDGVRRAMLPDGSAVELPP